ncbi:CvpA family protein [Phycisphaera mikurensis]|uniref:CvpA family protein n=1 Tax=Phycisphaera mikurensis (strain NBRC 102666 / KCTC 22515 / FYK2301M01) TaxID=1142394 RepID=I0IED6_PHYMF|nr:CvpA family protein [Phycisphaera mikurensis]MBB6441424.1 hypothetical protein [Phycisphaera mikurensis]BAM03624.1 hypothetical protein PSMK_14650 [Phycisphaera mikurensis NBRC 102666]
MILNILVLVLVLAMAIFWSTQGLFSAFIHLVATVVAGAIAFAVWEPVTLGLLLDPLTSWAWATGLLLPFALALIVLRILSNKVIGGNLKLPSLADQGLAGLVGAVSGVLTAGVCLLGVSFLPLGPALLGYQPVEVQTTARLGPPTNDAVTTSLWIPVDRLTADFFAFASTHGFSSHRPLGLLRPDLDEAAARFRIGQFYDPNASLVANPSTVAVEAVRVYDGELPAEVPALLGQFIAESAPTRNGDRLVLVTTRWEALKDTATFDEGILRLPPVQTVLLAAPPAGPLAMHLPVGWSKKPVTSSTAAFYGVVDNRSYASSELPEETITFVYAIPENQDPVYFETRMLRIPLGEPEQGAAGDGAVVADLLGEPAIEAGEEGDAGGGPGVNVSPQNAAAAAAVGEPVGNAALKALSIEATNRLPGRISINAASGLDVEEKEVISGRQNVQKGDRTATVDSIRTPPGQVMVRLELSPMSTSQALPTRVVAKVAGGDGRYKLVDTRGNEFFARATVWQKDAGEQEIHVTDRLDNAADLPINRLQDGDRLFAYFAMPDGLVLDRFVVGTMEQDVDFTVGE